MKQFVTKLLLLGAIISGSAVQAEWTGIATGVVGVGLKESAIGKPDAQNQIKGNEDNTKLFIPISLDGSFICVRPVTDWLEMGGMVGLGFNIIEPILSENQDVTREIVNAKLGVSLKHHYVLVNFGLKFGYRTIAENSQYKMTNSLAVGVFHQSMFMIPLPSDDWKIVLMGEVYGDVNPARLKGKFDTDARVNFQTGFKLGIGFAYCVFGKI